MMKANSVKWCTRKTNSCVHVGQKQWDIGGRHEWREGWSAQHNDTHLRNGSTVQWICRCTAQWIYPSFKAPSLIYSRELCVVTERTRLWTQAAEMNVLCLGRCSRHVPLGGDPEEDTLERLWLSAGLGRDGEGVSGEGSLGVLAASATPHRIKRRNTRRRGAQN